MSEPSAFGPDQVILSVTVEINGRRLYAQSGASLRHWQQSPEYREGMKAHLLQTLGEAAVKELAPEITVTMPGPPARGTHRSPPALRLPERVLMSHRPYPSTDRALHQLGRHRQPKPTGPRMVLRAPLLTPEHLQFQTAFQEQVSQLVDQAQLALVTAGERMAPTMAAIRRGIAVRP